jgi:hypothetical protein
LPQKFYFSTWRHVFKIGSKTISNSRGFQILSTIRFLWSSIDLVYKISICDNLNKYCVLVWLIIIV